MVAAQNYQSLRDNNIRSAIGLWMSDSAQASLMYGPIENWDVSRVTNFTSIFDSTQNIYSVDLSAWNTAAVTTLRAAFYNSVGFSGNIASWNTTSVTDMRVMLAYASDFTSDISQWDVSNVANMRAAFAGYSYSGEKNDTTTETLPISGWETTSLEDMEGLFADTSYFHTDLSQWDTSRVTSMAFMLEKTENFYGGDLSKLKTSNVVNMENMFANAINVRGARDISRWDTSSVTSMHRIFFNSTITFDQGTAPQDSDLFYLCWDLSSLEGGSLTQAFCNSNAGGFNCACVNNTVEDTINSECHDNSRKHCFSSLGDVQTDFSSILASSSSGSEMTQVLHWSLFVLLLIPFLDYC